MMRGPMVRVMEPKAASLVVSVHVALFGFVNGPTSFLEVISKHALNKVYSFQCLNIIHTNFSVVNYDRILYFMLFCSSRQND